MEDIIEYKLLGRIEYKGNKYNVYRDNDLQKFYLKIVEDNGMVNLVYPTLEEYLELNKKFLGNCIKKINCVEIKSEKKASFNSKGQNDLVNVKMLRFVPRVIARTGLVSLSTALLLTGCGFPRINRLNMFGTRVESEATTSEEPKDVADMTDIELLEYYYGSPVEEIAPRKYVLPTLRIESEVFTICQNAEQFRKCVGMEKRPTYDDLLNAVASNSNITGKHEKWLKEAIINLSHNPDFDNVDFSAFLYNLQRMTIEEKSLDEVAEDSEKTGAAAYFRCAESKVVISKERDSKFVFLHEALGHSVTEVLTEDGIFFRTYVVFVEMKRAKNGDIGDINAYMNGDSLEEGKADFLTEVALNNSEVSPSSYDVEKETFRELKETLQLSWADIINNSMTLEILLRMRELGMSENLKYIDNADLLHEVHEFEECDDSITFKSNIGAFMIDYAQSQMKSGKTLEEVLKQIVKVLNDSPSSIGTEKFISNYFLIMQEFKEYVVDSIIENSYTSDVNEEKYSGKVRKRSTN